MKHVSAWCAATVGLFLSASLASQIPDAWSRTAIPRDAARDVASFADSLEPSLVSVVRVEALSAPESTGGVTKSIGSGVVIDALHNLVLTNNHVVAEGKAYKVQLATGQWLKAELVGVDVATDLAVLRVEKSKLKRILSLTLTASGLAIWFLPWVIRWALSNP